MPRRLITTYAMLGRCQTPQPPPPSPPPPSLIDNSEEDNDLYFEEDDYKGTPELAVLNAKFRTDKEWEAVEEEDDDDLNFSDDGRIGEKAVEQRAILAFYELAKKAEANARAREEDGEEQLRHALDISIQRASTEEAAHRLLVKERQRLLEDAAECRALFARIQRGRRRVAVASEKRKR
jgi:hypothetical protein